MLEWSNSHSVLGYHHSALLVCVSDSHNCGQAPNTIVMTFRMKFPLS